ncbi:maleylpyruvate isomerase N-terminal domain-containing protein [Actinosynnema sp. NPDC020468]|uniref:maleylpyruvate isomerase N-terminal domain-containing protein n=1 Tax=Actinosynnema sp. NPDC020468 TaxID=3154488 RepID=UPI0034068567
MSRGLVDYRVLLDVITAEAGLLAAAVDGQRPERQVPACPGLNLGEAARHVGSTYRMVTTWLREGSQPLVWQQDPFDGQTLAEYVRAGAGPLVEELAVREPEAFCRTWWPDEQNHAFWARRLAHESTVHRMDVQSAAGLPLSPVADDVAVDGVDEVLSLWLGHRLDVLGVRGTREATVSLRTGGRVWLAGSGPRPATARLVPRDGPWSADGDVTAPPTTLYRWLWGRLPDRDVVTRGDRDAIAQLWALLRLATK